MSKVTVEQLGHTCMSEAKNTLPFNKEVQPTIGKIKDLTLVMCSHPEI
jgi:hypothetical protein